MTHANDDTLIATDLWFGYTERAVVRGVSLEVSSAAIVGILGPNGSGKTSLLRLLAGTRAPQRGTVTLGGRPLAGRDRSELARHLAVVPQETQLAFEYTAGEVAMMGRYPHLGAFEIEGPGDDRIVNEALAATGTLALKDRLFSQLSGGEKQRVVIAAALAQIDPGNSGRQADHSAGFLLLDEPTASLDLGYQFDVAELLTRLHRERQLGIVICTHDLSLAATLCDRLVLMREGAVAAAGPADAVLTPAHIRTVYGVDAEIMAHSSGRRLVVTLGRSAVAP